MNNDFDLIHTFEEINSEIVDLIAQKIQNSTVAIYYQDINKEHKASQIKPESIATGVLLKTLTSYYLITAAHTFNKNDHKDVYYLYKSRIRIPLIGRLGLYDPKDSKINDLIDVAFIKLEKVTIDLINKTGGIDFLSHKFIKENHNPINSKSYFTLGFPFKKEKGKKSIRQFFSQPYLFNLNPSKLNSYNRPKVNSDLNILMDFHRRKFKDFDTGLKLFAPKYLEGMSGSGLWFVPKFHMNSLEEPEVYLIGVFTEMKYKPDALMFTKIDCITKFLN
ncbi:MAG: hypothetical protein ACI9Y7_000685 [Dokdonia sp.]|jgi:hypothetical protein